MQRADSKSQHHELTLLTHSGYTLPASRVWLHDKDITGASTHLAFAASERAIVDEFWRAALQVGGRDNGEPGIRHHYHSHYYAAYILDPDGNNIEVVCQKG
ncbi:VOC family protein [Pantoea sp. GCM10028869]|uniref:VOC family protein n=1 Tax=Pantoea sp. GCM10028869 TaxID=3273417 RepID=UPI003612DB91